MDKQIRRVVTISASSPEELMERVNACIKDLRSGKEVVDVKYAVNTEHEVETHYAMLLLDSIESDYE